MNVRYLVELTDEDCNELLTILQGGQQRVRIVKRAQILVAADAGCSTQTSQRASRLAPRRSIGSSGASLKAGLQHALHDQPRSGSGRKLTDNEEALLVALACSDPPEGRARRTVKLLADRLVQLTEHDQLSRETVRPKAAREETKAVAERMWCIPKVDAKYVARMEDVLDLYAEQPDTSAPVVCFDETPVQLIGESRTPIPAEPGKPQRIDYEYRRDGVANLFAFLDAHEPWRHVKVTEQRTRHDFAHCMRDLVDVHYPEAERVRVVLDNTSPRIVLGRSKRRFSRGGSTYSSPP